MFVSNAVLKHSEVKLWFVNKLESFLLSIFVSCHCGNFSATKEQSGFSISDKKF